MEEILKTGSGRAPDKQLLLMSNNRRALRAANIEEGTTPSRELLLNCSVCNDDKEASEAGIVPLRKLPAKFKTCRLRLPKHVGIVPVILELANSNRLNGAVIGVQGISTIIPEVSKFTAPSFFMLHIKVCSVPDILFLAKFKSTNFVIEATVVGIAPINKLSDILIPVSLIMVPMEAGIVPSN